MKHRRSGLAAVLIPGLFLLSLPIPGCQGGQVAADQPQFQALMEQMKVSRDVPDAAKKTLAQQIMSDFEGMEALFKAKDFHCLAKLMGKRGASLVTTGFEKIPGAASAEYWRSLWKEGAELKLVAVNVFVHSLKERALVPYCAVMDEGVTYEEWKKNPPYYDAAAIVTFDYQVGGPKAEGSSPGAADPPGMMLLLHKTNCPWG